MEYPKYLNLPQKFLNFPYGIKPPTIHKLKLLTELPAAPRAPSTISIHKCCNS